MVRYPQIRVRVRSRNPLAVVAAVREEMRRAGIDPGLIRRFSDEALSQPAERISAVCSRWVELEHPYRLRGKS